MATCDISIYASAAVIILGTRGAPNSHGGFEALAEHLIRASKDMGFECLVIGNRDPDIDTSLVGRITSVPLMRSLETPLRTWSVRKRARGSEPVLVVNPVNVLTALWLDSRGSSVLLHMDGMEDQRGKWGFFAKRAHRMARFIAAKSNLTLVTDSKAIQTWYRHTFHKDSVYIAYGGCQFAESDSTHRWNEGQTGDYYMVVARPEPENQIFEMCSAFLQSTSPWRLVVVGAPARPTPYWRQVVDLVADSGRVQLAGSIYDRERLCGLYRGTRGVIHGHTVGGTNPSLVDALSHGCPVFAHANPYNREVVGANIPMWSDVQELERFFSTDLLPRSFVDTGEFIRRYNWTDVTNAYLEAFSRMN